MQIEIVQHESNKVVKEATLEQALEYAHNFTVNLVDSEGNRTPFVPAEHAPADEGDVGDVGEPTAADHVNEEVDGLREEAATDAPAVEAAADSAQVEG